MQDERYSHLVDAVRAAALGDDATLELDVRRAAMRGLAMPDALAPYVRKLRERAYAITDADIDGLRAAGYSEDQLFELTVCAALGAGLQRLEVGLAALEGAE